MKSLGKLTIILISSWFIGILALVISYGINSPSLEQNLVKSSRTFSEEGVYPKISELSKIKLDIFLML